MTAFTTRNAILTQSTSNHIEHGRCILQHSSMDPCFYEKFQALLAKKVEIVRIAVSWPEIWVEEANAFVTSCSGIFTENTRSMKLNRSRAHTRLGLAHVYLGLCAPVHAAELRRWHLSRC